ncbi:MAG: indole-3-glycerol phosphate synthase TrpC [Desulfuromonadales bacterium]|nr:indole-3-glycerol phosphate synthase TrpC [Desulfuromonadales bacterium]
MILDKIAEHKRREVALAKRRRSLMSLQRGVDDLEDHPRGFLRALRATADSGWTAVIAEVKKGSPSKGVIRADFDPLAIAGIYQDNGATCLSVLTDEHFFMGHLLYLGKIREVVNLPLLRKDFICDPYQIYEARVAGADAILLIAAMLDAGQLAEYNALATELHLDVLLEVHDESELETALTTGCELIGINNRNLQTFEIDLATTERLLPLIPAGYFVVAESGIVCRADILRLQHAGAQGFLVGESLMREDDIGAKLRELQVDIC